MDWIATARYRPQVLVKLWRRHLRDLQDLARTEAFETARAGDDGLILLRTRAQAAAYAAARLVPRVSPEAVLKSVQRVARISRSTPERYNMDLDGMARHMRQTFMSVQE